MEKIIKDFPNYKITTEGKVFSQYAIKSSRVDGVWKEVKPVLCSATGYLLVTLCHEGVRKNKRIHRLLMESFVPNPLGKKQINHIDTNKQNNSLSNLEWATPSENTQHAVDHGLMDNAIQAASKAVLQLEIGTGKVIASYSSIHEAGRQTGIAWQNISKVVLGKRTKAGGFTWAYKNV